MEVTVPEGTVSAWYNPKITKARGTYRPSELWKLLDAAKLLGKVEEFKDKITTEELLVKFMEQFLKDKTISFIPVTVTGKDGTQYSLIQEVLTVD